MNATPPSAWNLQQQHPVFNCPIFQVIEKKYVHPIDHRQGTFYTLNATDWIQVVALTDRQQLVMVQQFRFGAEKLSLETPGGIMDPGEDPITAALRELREETGYAGERPHLVTSIHPNPALLNNQLHVVAVENCKKIDTQHLDPNEEITVQLASLAKCLQKVRSGEIHHGIAALTLTLYALHKNEL